MAACLLNHKVHLSELDFELPKELIADKPVEPRESCRLLVVHRKEGKLEHRSFTDLPDFLKSGDLLVLNSARVTPARLYAAAEGISFEMLILDAADSEIAHALVAPSRKMRPGMSLRTQGTQTLIRVQAQTGEGQWELVLDAADVTWRELLAGEGHMPLPPYILKRRKTKVDVPEDRFWYQTEFADREGAIAAPTAGLHFTQAMLAELRRSGIDHAKIFLKVGMGTFLPVRTERLEDHVLLPEEYEVSIKAAEQIRQCKGRVVAVGTTAVRTLEFVAKQPGGICAGSGSSDLLIAPPYDFRSIHALITNFHLPKSTLLALVYAFGGTELLRHAYREAVREQYRFFSYGDAMLIL